MSRNNITHTSEESRKATFQIPNSLESLPLTHIQIEPTTRCNFSCKFCCGRSMKQSDFNFDLFKEILAMFPDLKHISLQGEGEPLLHPQFPQMASLAKMRGIKLSFITNGSLLRSEVVDMILNIPFEKVLISIESVDRGKFKDIRGGDLDKVTQGIQLLIEERDKRGLGNPVVGLAVTVLRDTKDELPKIASLYKKLNLDGGISVQPLQKNPFYYNAYPDVMKNQTLSKKEEAEIHVLTSPMFNMLNYPEFREINRKRSVATLYAEELWGKLKLNSNKCPFLEHSLYINAEGFVTACCMVKNTGKFSLGKIGEDHWDSILKNRDRMRLLLRDGKTPEACANCFVTKRRKEQWGIRILVFQKILAVFFKHKIFRRYV